MNKIIFCLLCIFICILVPNIALSIPIVTPVTTSFDTGFEGWTPTVPSETTWESVDGNPDGYVRHSDVGVTSGQINAPASYLGDWTNLNGTGSISFDHKIFSTGFIGIIVDYEINISGPGGESAKWTSTGPIGETDWVTLSAQIEEPSWVVVGTWDSLLSSVASLRIRIEMVDNDSSINRDITGIDNIILSGGVSAVPEPTTIVLFGIGLVGLVGAEVRRRKKAADKS